MKPLPGIGEIWRDDLGRRFVVVGVEDGMIQVKSAKESKRDLAHSRGAHVVAPGEFARNWTRA